MALLGGRVIHPINVCVGGFYKVPNKATSIAEHLKWARDAALETVRWTSRLEFPKLAALRNEGEYPFNEGRIVSSRGLDLPFDAFEGSCPVAWCRSSLLSGVGREGQLAKAGRLTMGSSLSGAIVSSVM